MSKLEQRKKAGEDSGNGKLFNEIQAISKALYLDKTQPRSLMPTASSRSKSVEKFPLLEPNSKSKDLNEDPLKKEKKSMWSWKTLKSFTHIRNKKFNCCFSLQVHSIEGLAPNFNDLSLCVHWKRRDGELITTPARVFQGVAEFEEELTNTCSVYGSRYGQHHSAKYEAKHFLLYASVYGMPELDLGKHRVDLTRLLPLTLEELEEKSSGKWTTSYRLAGEAKGANLNVSFGYSVVNNAHNASLTKLGRSFDHGNDRSFIARAGSLPSNSQTSSRSVEDIKDLHEVLPISKSKLTDSVNLLYQKLDEEKSIVEPLEPNSMSLHTDEINVDNEFSVLDHGIELPVKEEIKPEGIGLKVCDTSDDFSLEQDPKKLGLTCKDCSSQRDELVVIKWSTGEEQLSNKDSLMQDLESALKTASDLAKESSDSQEITDNLDREDCLSEDKSDFEESEEKKEKSFLSNKESLMEELESTSDMISNFAKEVTGIPDAEREMLNQDKSKPGNKLSEMGKSLSLDIATETVACDFLDMLGIEHSPFGLSSGSEPESPRERLLRQFEKDALVDGFSLFSFDIDGDNTEVQSDALSCTEWATIPAESNLLPVKQSSEDMLRLETERLKIKPSASLLEDLETEALMREWGLNEKAFQSSPPNFSPSGFGSPIDLPPEEPLHLPPLGEGLGPFIQTSNGGFLRSMNPELFRNAKSGGSLIMQVSNPVVVPAEMGEGIMDMLQHLASVGIEKLSMQANKLMPLEDITGKTMQQIAWEAGSSLEAPESQYLFEQDLIVEPSSHNGQTRVREKLSDLKRSNYEPNSFGTYKDSEYVLLEDLAPLAMDKIEALSVEGLRIQSGMSDEDAPSNITSQSLGEISALEGKKVNFNGSLGLEGAGGLKLLDIKDKGDDIDGIMGLSITLDEWLRLDSGEIDGEDEISERTAKILTAHHASDMMRAKSGERKRGRGSKRCGLLGNNFTVALMVQLRDPLRDFEPVGTPMLALIQVERVFVPPKPKIYSTVFEVRTNSEDEDENESFLPVKKQVEEEKVEQEEPVSIPQFKITDVHVAGLKTEASKKKLWGSNVQQQSGSRWLVANGMGKKNGKHPLMKSKPSAKSSSSAAAVGDSLWSISSKGQESGKPTRNPNVMFANETVRLLSGAGFC